MVNKALQQQNGKKKGLQEEVVTILEVGVLIFSQAKWYRNTTGQLQNSNLWLTECEGGTGEYWPKVVAVRTERSEVRTKTTEGQYSPVRLELARLVSSLLYGTRTMLVLSLRLSKTKNTQLMTVSTETVRMAKSWPRKNQSERSDLPCHIIINLIDF